jgi:hypothetical protein
MSDMQMGTRGLSSGDLTRLKRLRGAGNDFSANKLNVLVSNRDINPPPVPQTIYPPNFHTPREMGTSKIRRTASGFTDFKGFRYADSVSQIQTSFIDPEGKTKVNNSKLLIATRLCDCTTSNPKKQGLCPKCSK